MDEEKESITLYEEYRLIEKSEQEINGAWKGAHLILFFMSFVFGSFCTFSFHILIYLFDENCILYPKVVSMKDVRRSGHGTLLFDHVQNKSSIPLDFVTTQWVEKSQCYLPAYVPLLSSICGVVWTTMYLMCSTGSRSLTGLQRPWRIQPAVFVFSMAIGTLCTYASYNTHNGLNEFCEKLGELTGSKSCTYTINVASLAYERKIRGVYQATRLTILSAWLHTFCWIGAAIVALLRVILIVDFRLVRVRADLIGSVEQMLERHEELIRTDEFWNKDVDTSTRQDSTGNVHINFINKTYGDDVEELIINQNEHTIHYLSNQSEYESVINLVSEQNRKVAKLSTSFNVPEEHRFIAHMLHELIDNILDSKVIDNINSLEIRQVGMQDITKGSSRSHSQESSPFSSLLKISHTKGRKASLAIEVFKKSIKEQVKQTNASTLIGQPSFSKLKDTPLKSNLKHRSMQTTEPQKNKEYKVQINALNTTNYSEQTLSQEPDSNRTKEFEKITVLKHYKSLSNITLTPSTLKTSEKKLKYNKQAEKPQSNTAELDYINKLPEAESVTHLTWHGFINSLEPGDPASPKTTPKETSEKSDKNKLNQNKQPPNLPLDVKKPLQEKGQSQHSTKERQDYEEVEEEEASTSKGKSKKDSAKEKQD